MPSIDPERAWAVYPKRMKVEPTFRDFKNLLRVDKNMSRHLAVLEKLLGMARIASGRVLLWGEALRDRAPVGPVWVPLLGSLPPPGARPVYPKPPRAPGPGLCLEAVLGMLPSPRPASMPGGFPMMSHFRSQPQHDPLTQHSVVPSQYLKPINLSTNLLNNFRVPDALRAAFFGDGKHDKHFASLLSLKALVGLTHPFSPFVHFRRL